jgi:hypothetical protein
MVQATAHPYDAVALLGYRVEMTNACRGPRRAIENESDRPILAWARPERWRKPDWLQSDACQRSVRYGKFIVLTE